MWISRIITLFSNNLYNIMNLTTPSSILHSVVLALLFILSANSKSFFFREKYGSSLGFYQCFKDQGYNDINMFYFPEYSSLSTAHIISAKNAGLNVHATYYSVNKEDPQNLARELRANFGANILSQIWIVPQYEAKNRPQNYQAISTDYEQNCIHLQSLISALAKYGFSGNVVTNKQVWSKQFGSVNSCPEVKNSQLWWMPSGEDQNGKPDFEMYSKIGGWDKPYMKEFRNVEICQQYLYESYYE